MTKELKIHNAKGINKTFQKAIDNYLHMLVHDATFNERKQREQLNQLTGFTGEKLDKLYKRIGEAIYSQSSGDYKLD